MKLNKTRTKILEAACILFYSNGYHGTSVRDIAKKSNGNVSLISYYFKNKQGLLESLMVDYFEQYLEIIEESCQNSKDASPYDTILNLVEEIIQYKQDKYQLTCFIHRELTLDNMFVREMIVTYLAKEKYLLHQVFKNFMINLPYTKVEKQYLFMQFKGLLMIPYMTTYDWKDQVLWDQSHKGFIRNYTHSIKIWLDQIEKKQDTNLNYKSEIG